MSDTTTTEKPYPSLAALRAVHNELLKSVRDTRNLNTVSIATDKVREFLVRGVATGQLIEHEDDRTTAQGLLDYWSALAYRVGQDIPDTTLAEYDHEADPELEEALCPYVGMRPFEANDAEHFFGRRRLINEFLLKRLQNTRILALVGAAGSGKSSVLRAGMLPALQAGGIEGSATWRYPAPITPGSDPLEQLLKTLPQPIERADTPNDPKQLAAAIAGDNSVPVLLLVDQFEELFTLTDNEQVQQAFIATLVALADMPGPRHTILIGMRSDIENTIARFPALYAWFERGRVQLMPLGAGEIREAIEKPAELIGLRFEAGLVEQLIQDLLGEPAALPLLQFTLLELWERRQKNRITWAAYNQVGSCRIAISKVADATYKRFTPPEQQLAKRMLLRLVNYEAGLTASTRRVRRAALLQGLEPLPAAEHVLATLITERLVRITDGLSAADDQLDLAHEALALNWPRMAEWLASERTALDIRRRLEARASEWAQLGRSAAGLLDPVQLAEAEGWVASADAQSIGFDESLKSLVSASRTAIEENQQREVRQAQSLAEEQRRRAEAETQRAEEQTRRAEIEIRRKRQIGSALIFIGFLAIIALALASYAIQQASLARTQEAAARIESSTKVAQAVELQTAESAANQSAKEARENLQIAESARATAEVERVASEAARATAEAARIESEERRIEARAGELSALALAARTDNPPLAILLAAESVKIGLDSGSQPAPVAISTLQQSLLYVTGQGYYRHNTIATNVAYDAAGSKLITADIDGKILIWNPTNLLANPQDIDTTFPINRMALSPNGRWLAAGSESSDNLRLWDLTAGSSVDLAAGGGVYDLIISADGRLLAAVNADGASRVWDLANVAAGPRLLSVRAAATAIAISPDGRWVLTGHADGIARLWNLASRDPISPAFTQDRRSALTTVGFSPNGRWMAISDDDGITHLWGLGSGGFSGGPYLLRGQSGSITTLAFTPSSELAITGSSDGSIFIWTIAARNDPPPRSVLRAHAGSVSSLAISPNGKQLASTGFSQSSLDNTIALWNLTVQDPGKDGQSLFGHSGGVSQAVYSPNGDQLASVSADTSLRIWDLTKPLPTEDSLPKDAPGLLALACQVAGRDIYAEEWQDLGFDSQPPRVCK